MTDLTIEGARKKVEGIVRSLMDSYELDGLRVEARKEVDYSFDGEDEVRFDTLNIEFIEVIRDGKGNATEGTDWRGETIKRLEMEKTQLANELEETKRKLLSLEMDVVSRHLLKKFAGALFPQKAEEHTYNLKFDLEEGVAIVECLNKVAPELVDPYRTKALKLINRMMDLEPAEPPKTSA